MGFERACAPRRRADRRGPAPSPSARYDVAVARDGDEVFAIQDLCSHAAVALTEGEVEDCTIECWLHGSRFDLRTGKPTSFPATEPVATFPVDVRAVPTAPATSTSTSRPP